MAFALISLFHTQIQEPPSRSTTTRAFVFLVKFAEFYYHKIFEKKNSMMMMLSLCVDGNSPCSCVDGNSPCSGLYIWRWDLSMSCNQKVMTLLPQWRNALWTSIKELFLLAKFDNSSHSVIRDKQICQSHVITSWSRVPNGTLSMRFTCCPNLIFLASPWLWVVQNWVTLLTFGK